MLITTIHKLGLLNMQASNQRCKRWMLSLLVIPMLIIVGTVHAATASRASAFEYDPISGLLTKEIIEPDDSNLCLVTTYTYDSFGNKIGATTRNCNGSAGSHPGTNSEAAAPAATIPNPLNTSQTIPNPAIIDSRTSATSYDSQGRFATSSTNALNQTETKTYNTSFGRVATLTGPNNLTTTWTYDSFGRPLTEARADGTNTSTAYALCDTGCPTVGTAVAKYTVTVTQAGAPSTKTYYDMNGRAIQTETQDVTGAVILTQVKYDNIGHSIATSRPFKAGQTPIWTTATYDKLDRPTSLTAPDNSTGTTTYNGYTTVTTNAKGQTKTEVKNSQGQLVTVTDTQTKSLTYQYDPFGNLTKTTDALGNITTMTYDKRGRKTGMDDPDQGIWSYQYDALGQLKRQVDAKLQIVTFTYDKLGRMSSRSEPDLISTWNYDTCDTTLNPAGKCVGKLVKESADNASARTLMYDAYGRPIGEYDAGTQIGLSKSYDSAGRTSNLIYSFSGTVSHTFQVTNTYSTSGHLYQVKNTSTSLVYWQAGATDNEGRLTQQTYGNGITNTTTFDPNTGRIIQIKAGPSDSVSNQNFVYDSIGNLTQRYDAVTNLNEAFGYDSLNRLTSTSAQAGSGPLTQVTMAYNEIGNIMSKSDVGTYTYASLKANGSARPHAVSKITMNDGTTIYANYTYDANGNTLTSQDANSKGRTLSWTSFNMPIQVTGNKPATSNASLLSTTPINTTSSSFQFIYNASHERVKEILPDGTVVLNMSPRVDTGIHIEVRTKTNGEVTFMGSLYAGAIPFGAARTVIATNGTKTDSTAYFHGDHLGSIVAITNDAGAVTERRSYDAWGKRRNLNGTSIANAFVTSDVRHAFTGHEDLGEVGLIHMNGRLYDPATGRFLSADPSIQYPDDMQNYNRYSYINNNPLAAVDYSGYGWNPFKSIKKLFKSIGKAIKSVLKNKVIRTIAAIVAAAYAPELTGALFGQAAAANAVISGAVGGFTAGLIGSGGDLRAALQGAVTGGAFGWTGGIENTFGGVASHAFIGCASSVASGGKCGSGALAAGFTKGFSGTIGDINDRVWRTVSAAVVGGTASVLGGGNFENGAITGAFSRLFNDEAHLNRRSVTITGGGAFITPVGGVAGNAGFYISTNPLDIGVIGTGQIGAGYDFGLSGQISFQKGDLSTSSNNLNISSGLINASASIDSNNNISVAPGINAWSIGAGPRVGASATHSRTGAYGFREFVRGLLGLDK